MTTFQRQCQCYPVCPLKGFFEEGRLDKKWIERYCKDNWKNCVRYPMEADGLYHPDNMLPDESIVKNYSRIS